MAARAQARLGVSGRLAPRVDRLREPGRTTAFDCEALGGCRGL